MEYIVELHHLSFSSKPKPGDDRQTISSLSSSVYTSCIAIVPHFQFRVFVANITEYASLNPSMEVV